MLEAYKSDGAADRVAGVQALLAPTNVVLVGASDSPGNWSSRVFRNLGRYGFGGNVHLVNPRRDSLWGQRTYPSVSDLPEAPDHLAIFIPADPTMSVLAEAARIGARSATLFAAGFGEGGTEEGRARGERLRALLHETGLAAAGPNCMGVASGASRFVTIADENLEILQPGPVAVIAQSGMLCASFARSLTDRGLPVSYLVSCGNQIGLTIADYVNAFVADPHVRVIVCYIEALPDAEGFFAAARAARAAGKSIVAVKAGASDIARAAALAHTGSLTGSVQVFGALAGAAGVVSCESIDDAVEAVEFLTYAPVPKGPRAALVTHSGAMKTLMSDAVSANGLEIAPLTQATRDALRGILEPAIEIASPLDTRRTLPAKMLREAIAVLRRDETVDFVVLTEELPRVPGVTRKLEIFEALDDLAATEPGVPLAVIAPLVVRDSDYTAELRKQTAHLPMLRGLGTSFRAFAALATAGGSSREGGRDRSAPPVDIADLLPAPGAEPRALDEASSKAILARYGIESAPERVAETPEEAARAAAALGFPVVLKGLSARITHKSDAGLVRLGLTDEEAVAKAGRDMLRTCFSLGEPCQGLLVARQMSDGIEMVLGLQRDPEMGMAMMVGLGGVWLELFRDLAFTGVDIDREDALRAIAKTRAATLLAGYRGAPPCDTGALAEAMVALARFGRDHADILESVDINPVLVTATGEGAVALDALIVLRGARQTN